MTEYTEFKRLNGTTMRIPSELLASKGKEIPFKVRFIQIHEEKALFREESGSEAVIPCSLLQENNINPETDASRISKELFKQWRTKMAIDHDAEVKKQLVDNLGKIIKNRDIIIEDPRYYLIRIPNFFVTGLMGYSTSEFSLGVWLEALESEPRIRFEENDGIKYLISAGGSVGSGFHSVVFWSETQQKTIYIKNYFDKWLPYYSILSDFCKHNTLHLQNNREASELLLKQITPPFRTFVPVV